jgi:hypothetical protein
MSIKNRILRFIDIVKWGMHEFSAWVHNDYGVYTLKYAWQEWTEYISNSYQDWDDYNDKWSTRILYACGTSPQGKPNGKNEWWITTLLLEVIARIMLVGIPPDAEVDFPCDITILSIWRHMYEARQYAKEQE